MKTFAFVFARGGSKGLPGKNIRKLRGKPLLAYSIEAAAASPEIAKCFVSTEDDAIAAVAQQHGATVIQRPAELATDTAPEWLAWQHAIAWAREHAGEFDRFISLPATAPLRNADDVQRCLDAIHDEARPDIVVTMTPSARSPWFNMVRASDSGCVDLLLRDAAITRRQDAPSTFDLTTVAYVSRPDFILRARSLWDGRVKGVVVSSRSAVDIDTLDDFLLAEFFLMQSSKDPADA